MVNIRIGPEARALSEATPDWVNQQINARRAAGEDPCVLVTIKEPGIDVALGTPSCGGGGGGRPANARELPIIQLWRNRHLSDSNFDSGNVVAFLQRLEWFL
jgi:hypothetical protein